MENKNAKCEGCGKDRGREKIILSFCDECLAKHELECKKWQLKIKE